MRKVLLCFLLCFCIISFGYAAPCYGPKMPEAKQLFTGLQVNSVFKRQLEKDYGKVRSLQHFFLLSYGLFDWLSLDLKGGVGNIRQRTRADNQFRYPTYLGGGYGFRVRLYDADKTKMIFGFQHISIHPYTISVAGVKHKAVLDNWQFSFLLSHSIFNITPYIGTKWSRMDNIHWADNQRVLEQSELNKSIGLVIGTDIPLSKNLWFNLEGQFFDETSASASLNLAF